MKEYIYTVSDEPVLFYYQPNFFDEINLNNLKTWLEKQNYKEGHCISGKEIPRLQMWYQREEKYFCEDWKCRYDRWKSQKYDEYLLNLEHLINIKLNEILQKYPFVRVPNINSCLVNKYRDGNDSIKPHRDTPQSFGEYPTIAGISIGDKRTLKIKKIIFNEQNQYSTKEDKEDKINLDIELGHNSLFIMAGASQKNFTHEILKNNSNKERYSLTFREHISV